MATKRTGRKRTSTEIIDAVADAARDLFLDRSPSAVSVREIAAAANVNLGLVHRYVGSKDDVIALVLARHTARTRAAAEHLTGDGLIDEIADVVVNRPTTGRLMAGMILDGIDIARLKGDFPLLERIGDDERQLDNAVVYALALGWEVFGPLLLAAIDSDADSDEVTATLARAMGGIAAAQP